MFASLRISHLPHFFIHRFSPQVIVNTFSLDLNQARFLQLIPRVYFYSTWLISQSIWHARFTFGTVVQTGSMGLEACDDFRGSFSMVCQFRKCHFVRTLKETQSTQTTIIHFLLHQCHWVIVWTMQRTVESQTGKGHILLSLCTAFICVHKIQVECMGVMPFGSDLNIQKSETAWLIQTGINRRNVFLYRVWIARSVWLGSLLS